MTEPVDTPTETPPEEPAPTTASAADRDAARYRKRLRDTEAQRDTLTAQLHANQRAQADSIIRDLGYKPQALWATGTDLDALLDEDGNVDPERVATATRQAADYLGISPATKRVGISGLHSGNMRPPPLPDTWADAFARKR